MNSATKLDPPAETVQNPREIVQATIRCFSPQAQPQTQRQRLSLRWRKVPQRRTIETITTQFSSARLLLDKSRHTETTPCHTTLPNSLLTIGNLIII